MGGGESSDHRRKRDGKVRKGKVQCVGVCVCVCGFFPRSFDSFHPSFRFVESSKLRVRSSTFSFSPLQVIYVGVANAVCSFLQFHLHLNFLNLKIKHKFCIVVLNILRHFVHLTFTVP